MVRSDIPDHEGPQNPMTVGDYEQDWAVLFVLHDYGSITKWKLANFHVIILTVCVISRFF